MAKSTVKTGARSKKTRQRGSSDPLQSVSSGLPADGAVALDFGPLDELVGYRLRKAYGRLFQTFSEMFRDLNLAFGQYSILLLIGHNPGVSQMAIAEAADVDRSTIVPILRKFVQHGWVRRTRRQRDRRVYYLRLTPAGESILKAAEPVIAAHEEQMFAALTRVERRMLGGLLSKIVD